MLEEIIIEKIRREGPLSFRDFMEMALYYPEHGYYTSAREKIGRHGDYFTAPVASPIYGALIARQLEEMWELLDRRPFTVVEYGAGTGALCKSILDAIKEKPRFHEKLSYCIIEKSPAMRGLAREKLSEKVQWYNSIHDIENFEGCILSNELFDNFSVHRVVMEDELKEIFVDHQNGFTEVLKPATPELKDYLKQLCIQLPKGFRTEINLEAQRWMKEASSALKKGFVLTIDYGFPSHELYEEHRSKGTLLCYNRHSTNEQPYQRIGRQDITAHVNFSALCLWGHQHGLDYCGYTSQGRFLQALGFSDYLRKTAAPGNDSQKFKREFFLTNTLLYEMGSRFKVLIQKKQVPAASLTGLSQSIAA